MGTVVTPTSQIAPIAIDSGTSVGSIETNLPNYVRPEVKALEKDIGLVHDLLEGTRTMHHKSKDYIHKWRDEDETVYNLRRKIEVVFGGLNRTLSAAVGMLFAIAPVMTWPVENEEFTDQWTNIDGAGTTGTVFMKRFAREAIADGFAAILVDHAPAPGEDVVVTAANYKALGLRPTWAMYSRKQIINWRTAVVNGMRMLTLVVLREEGEVDDGLYGVRAVCRYRVLRLVNGQASWSLYRQVKEPALNVAAFVLEASGFFRNYYGEVSPEIPFAIAYTGDTKAPMTATIPLMDVAWANLAHWQISTDIRFYRALCAFPQPTITGALAQEPGMNTNGQQVMNPGRLRLGPVVAVMLQENGKFEWTELSGKSLDQLEKGQDEKMHAMSTLGMSFLTKDVRGVQTAESMRLDAVAENATLATAAQGVEDGVNQALKFHAWYLGLDPHRDAPTTRVSRDFENTVLDAQTMLVYVQAISDAGLPIRFLLEAWKAGGRLPPDIDTDQLELEMMSNLAANKAAQADALAAQNDNSTTLPKGGA